MHRAGGVLAVAIGLAGFAGMAAFMLPRLLGMADELIQVVVPGEAELTLGHLEQ
ncbi:MAG: hypothetical protein GY877_13390 [Hyphomicrobium sp.]|nr:hypothetical protein [Hyphomicrobium sp.]